VELVQSALSHISSKITVYSVLYSPYSADCSLLCSLYSS